MPVLAKATLNILNAFVPAPVANANPLWATDSCAVAIAFASFATVLTSSWTVFFLVNAFNTACIWFNLPKTPPNNPLAPAASLMELV